MKNQETKSLSSAEQRESAVDEISVFSAGSLGGDAALGDDVDLRIAVEKAGWLDPFLEVVSDQFSSIMVKETRQATKSKHFVWTFFATIIITLVVTLVVISDSSVSNDLGQSLLMGYLVILGLPLMIIVPISAFQSLSAEHGDGTLQLISITTMKPSEIIIGKMCSSILQILIYMSVLAPCVTFTFLLRGVDIYQIMSSLLLAFGCSVSLSCLGLAMASISTTRMISAGVQILFGAALLGCAWLWCFVAYGMAREFGRVPSEAYFWIAGWICMILSTALLLLVAATAQISFDSDNRSTYLRIAMLVQQTLFIGFMIGVSRLVRGGSDVIVFLVILMLHYWLVMGGLMMMASHQLSNRVRRSMPRTILGKSFGGLLMPGPGRAFLFSWTNGMFGCLIGAVLVFRSGSAPSYLEAVILSMFYFALFLSTCYLFNRFLKRHSAHAPLWLGLFSLGIVMFAPTVLVVLWETFDSRNNYLDRGFLKYTNWYAALRQVQFTGQWNLNATNDGMAWAGYWSVAGLAMVTTFFAMLSACREFAVTAIATPAHVLEEDKAHAERNPLGQKEESIDDIFK